jgi:hypothetical protein
MPFRQDGMVIMHIIGSIRPMKNWRILVAAGGMVALVQ